MNQCETEGYLSEIGREQELFLTKHNVFCLKLKIVLNYKYLSIQIMKLTKIMLHACKIPIHIYK